MTDSKILQQASHWLIELETVPDLDTIWKQFETWLHEDPEHLRVYESMEEAWTRAGNLMRRLSPAQIEAFRNGRYP